MKLILNLDAILVLAPSRPAIVRKREEFWQPIALRAAISFVASVATWFVVVARIDGINAPELHVQAGTGVLAIVVLLVILNWSFHKVYRTGWFSVHEQRKRTRARSSDSRSPPSSGYLTFVAQRKMPFKNILVATGIMLGGVLLVMVGASSGLLQEAGWLRRPSSICPSLCG